ncbi:class I SAM-dependent DNA methyltransferase [Xanthobacter agilis]|uniref:TPR repeat methyltransferase n=1 Tax=Xanthobacter agilis TaxID=47492 RepID=A0ABU0LIM8_XANAG|nr:methyltransferase [Xanthobacter agilis]MDQ0506986.1 putative TPR repeat methyltransferase [Xanthobacter agilis]
MAALPHSASSGDPALDRRLDWARALCDEGDWPAAADLLADTVAAAPGFAAAWFLLGEARQAAGDAAGAAEAFATARACDADDTLGAGLRLARLGQAPAEGAMSAAYVRTLFDQYADRFDSALRDKLAYRGPELLLAALVRVAGEGRRFRHGLDLGCGTGLAAPLIAPRVEVLDGVDLSPAMLAKAETLGLYGRLDAADMGDALAAAPRAGLDLIVAADALCYLADLQPLFAAAARALAPGGLFAFTVETHEGVGVLLRETLRYAHAAATVRAAANAAGLDVRRLEEASTRTEKGVPVPGLVGVLERP